MPCRADYKTPVAPLTACPGLPALPGGTRAAMPAPTTTTQAASTAAGTAKGSEVPTSLATGRATAAAPAVKASEVPTSQMKAQTTSTVAAVKAKEGTPKDTSQTPATHAVRHVTLPSTAAPRSIAAPGGGSGTFLTQEDDDGDDDGAGAGQLARVRDVAHRITSLGKSECLNSVIPHLLRDAIGQASVSRRVHV